jgi:acetyl-CoA acetyltransferase
MKHPGARLRNRYAVVGVGQSEIGEVPGSTSLGLLTTAMKAAIEDAGLTNRDVDGLITRGPDDIYCHHQRMGQRLGIDASFSTSTDNGGASQILSVALACMAIDAGLCETVVTGFGRNTWSRKHQNDATRMRGNIVPQSQEENEFEPEFGYFGAPATHGFGARRHMALYGTSREHFGHIAVAFRDHAARNPGAQKREPLTLDKYLAARLIVDPFGLYDCSLVTDGAGALVITSAERARDLPQPPAYIAGFGFRNNLRGWFYDDHMVDTAAQQASRQAFEMAGLGPQDVDCAQIYDCFTYMVLTQLEDYGFCAKGEGGPFVASGALGLGGALPTNTAGGQLSEGHCEGMLQIVEAARQVRRDHPADRQVADCNVAIASGHGGNTVCHSSLLLQRTP